MENLKSSYVPSPAAKAGSGHISKEKEEGLYPTSFRLKGSLRQRARVYAALNGVSMQEMLNDGLEMWLDEHEKKENAK